MNRRVSLKRNYIYKLAYELLLIIAPFVTTPYISRVLEADGIGTYSYVNSYMSYFTMFAKLGTASYGVREIARCRDNRFQYSKTFWEIESLSIITTSFCLAIWLLVLIFKKADQIYFAALTPLLLATLFDISWFFTAHENNGYTIFWNALCKIAGIACIFLFVKKKSDLPLYILIQSLITLTGNVSMWLHLPLFLVKVDHCTLRLGRHFKETLVYFIPTIATSLYLVLDKTLLGIFTATYHENGYYEQASKIIHIGKTCVFVAVNTIMEARISYLFKENKYEEIRGHIDKSIDFILLLGTGFAFGIIGIAPSFVPSFFGEGYAPTVQLLYFMSPLVVIIGISNCIGSHYYTPSGLRAKSAKYIVFGAFSNLLLNLLLIPKFQAKGAVISTLIAETAISGLYLANCENFLTLSTIISKIKKKFGAGFAMCVLLRIMHYTIKSYQLYFVAVQVAVGIIFYFLILILLKDSMITELLMMIKKKISSCESEG